MPAPSFKIAAALFSITLGGSLHGATVSFNGVNVSYNGAGSSTMNTAGFASTNLSDLTGLTPGQSIQISFTPTEAILWDGLFFYADGQLEINWRATVEISVGGHTMTYTDLWNFGPAPATGGSGGVGGAIPGPDPIVHSFVVPWGTNLSSVLVTVKDLSSINGSAGAYFTESRMALSGATFVTTSVPEPSGVALLGLAPAAMLLRRRRV